MGILDSLKTAAADGLKKTAASTSKAVVNSSSRAIESVISKTTAAVGSKVTDAILNDINSPHKADPKPTPPPNPASKPDPAASKTEPKQLSPAELEAIIEARVKEKGIPSNWRYSVVDLLTVLDMESSLDARKALAERLNYFGYDADGSAEKNNWLHAELLKALAQNGGEVPSSLLFYYSGQ